MKLILVTGIEQTDKNKLIGMAISTLNNGNGYKDFSHINFDGLDSVRTGFLRLADVKESYLSLYEELEKQLTSSKRNAFNIVLDASFTINTSYGYVPLVTERFFSIFRPDVIVVLEARLEDYKDNPKVFYAVKEQQEINKMYCVKYAANFGIPIKIIRVNKSEVRSTVKEIQDYFVSIPKGG